MSQDQDAPVPLEDCIAADRCHHRSLAAGRRNHGARVIVAGAEMLIDRIDGGLLIGTQCNHLFNQLFDVNCGLAPFHGRHLLDVELKDLAVIQIGSPALQSIEQAFETVVDVSATAVRGKDVYFD